MRVVVVGAGGRTGRLIVEKLVAAGHKAVATIRNPKHMAAMVSLGAETVMLDLELSTGPDFQAQFKGADAIVFAAGSAAGESSAIDRSGRVKTARGAETVGVRRYNTIGSIGASTGMIVANVLPAVQLVVLGSLLIVAIIATNLIYSRTQR